jgi:hypothetical protein
MDLSYVLPKEEQSNLEERVDFGGTAGLFEEGGSERFSKAQKFSECIAQYVTRPVRDFPWSSERVFVPISFHVRFRLEKEMGRQKILRAQTGNQTPLECCQFQNREELLDT